MTDTVQISMSPTVGKIAEAMAKAQLTMRPAVKDATNPHFKNRYASLVSCFEAVRPLNENGIAVFQPPASHGPDGVCVATLLVHSSGEWIRGELYMPAAKKDPQGFGSALSYARRYCLVATVGIAADDDDDAEAAVRPPNLEKQLAASVEWGDWEAKAAKKLQSATTIGDLQETWADVYERAKGSPNGTMKRLTAAKDARKAELAR